MKQYYRDFRVASYPIKLVDNNNKTKWYKDLRDSDNKIRDRWNTTLQDGRKIIREELHKVTNGCCSYCGKRINLKQMDVDHFLPSHEFNYLSYCWLNYIPSCKTCNQSFKHKFFPKSLKGKIIIEHCCQELVNPFHMTYNQNTLFAATEDRIIDPFYDDISKHLTFKPLTHSYEAHSEIGRETKRIFFDRDEFKEELEGISLIVKGLIKNDNPRSIIKDNIEVHGSEYYYNAYWDFWISQKNFGMLT